MEKPIKTLQLSSNEHTKHPDLAFLIPLSIKMKQRSLEKKLIPVLGTGKYKVNRKLLVPLSKEMFQDLWGDSKSTQELASTGPPLDNSRKSEQSITMVTDYSIYEKKNPSVHSGL